MKKIIKKYIIEIITISIILSLSLMNIYKAPLLSKNYNGYFFKMIIFIILSIFIGIILNKIKFKKIYKYRYIIYLINIFLLIYVLIFSSSINHVKAWINLGFISIQPSEFTKITCPLLSISFIKDKKYLKSFIIFLIPMILILIEPDTGNVLLLFIIFLFLVINKNNKKLITSIIIILLIISSLIIFLFITKEKLFINLFNGSLYYRLKRIISFKNNYQIQNALISIGNAKAFPIPLKDIIIYIPEGVTDFIFSFSIANIGIILTIVLLMSYLVLILALVNKYIKIKNIYKKKIYGSFITVFTFQTTYNILMNIGIVPIMGIPLPLYSYGGSSIISYFIFLFLINKKISSIEDKDNNNYKNNFHKVPEDKNYFDMELV